jgi:TolB-like protein/Flp pilus assembly protein TadD
MESTTMASKLSSFLAELKRRKVYRVAGVYAVVAFVVWQAAEIAFPALSLPDWTLTFVVAATLLGFPIALVLAWAFDITPQGVQRTGPTAGNRRNTVATLGGVALLALVLAVGWHLFAGNRTEPDRKSIAVLPLDNLSGDESTAPFVAGIHDDLLTHLYKIADLKVISRTSVMEYEGTRKNLREIADELGVATVLEGGVQRVGNRVRINFQLIDAQTDEHLWAEDYDRELTTDNIFAVQSDVALQVAAALKSVLSPSEQAQIELRPTESLEAYDYYLRGNEYDRRSGELDNQRTAIQLWTRSIEVDPTFPLPYAKLVMARCLIYFGSADRSEDHVSLAAAAITRLRELAPDLGETHLALGIYYYQCLGDYDRAMEEFALALAAQPNNSIVYAGIASVQRRRGEWEQAADNWVKTAELDPLFYHWREELAYTYLCMGRYAKADSLFNHAIALAPDVPGLRVWRAINLLSWQGDIRAARSILEPMTGFLDSVDASYLAYYLFLMDISEGDYGGALGRLSPGSSPALETQHWLYTRAQLAAEIYSLQGDPERARIHYDSARAYLEARIREEPEDARLYRSLGVAYAGLGLAEEAVRTAKRAVDLMPVRKDAVRGPEAVEGLARVYTMTGDYDAAVEQLKALLSVPSYYSLPLLRIDPAWEPLRNHPDFRALMEGYGEEREAHPN